MAKLILYLALTAVGIVATLLSPFAGAIATLEAYLLNPSAIVGDYFDFRYQLWITISFIVSYLLYRPAKLPAVGREGRLLTFLWIFVAIGALSATWAVVSSKEALDAIFEVFKTVLFLSILVCVIKTEKQICWLINACLVGLLHACIAQTFGVRFGYVPTRFGAEYGVLPDTQAPIVILFVPILFITAMMAASRWEKLLSWLIIPFALNSLVSTYRRTPFVSLAAELVLIFLLLPKRILIRVLPVVLVGIALFVFRLAPADYWARMQTIEAPTQESSANSRFLIANASLQILADYPMGVGYRNYPEVSPRYLSADLLTGGKRSAHNSFFSVACETGYLGFLAWISAFVGTIWYCRRIRKTADFRRLSRVEIYAMGIEIGLYGWLLGGLFQADHEIDPAYWFVGFTVVLTRLHFQRKASAGVPPEDQPKEISNQTTEQVGQYGN